MTMLRRCRQPARPSQGPARFRRQGGFTLIEAALTTVIVGTGVLAIVAAQQAYHMKNQWAKRAGTGMLLANELRELMASMPLRDPITKDSTIGPEENDPINYDDIDDFTNVTIGDGSSGDSAQPLTGMGQRADSLSRWSQQVMVEEVTYEDVSGSAVAAGTGDVARVTVIVYYDGPNMAEPEAVTQLSWTVAP